MSIQGVGTLFPSLVPLAVTATIVASCGGSAVPVQWADDGGTDGGGPGAASGSGSGSGSGGGSSFADASTRQDATTGPGSGSSGGGGTLDATLSPDTSSTTPVSEGGPSCDASGTCGCPPYETLCSGACIVTNLDPNNCGACGHACAAGQACSAGVCSSTCTTPTNGGTVQIIKCGQACVDMWTDNKNCGACGVDCTTSNEVCVGGSCVASTISVDAGAKLCSGGGPFIDITTNGAKTCVGTLAQTTFRFGLCTCGNVSLVNSGQSWPGHPGLNFPALYLDAYDSSKGPWDPNAPEVGGSLGVNGTFRSSGGASTLVTGHWWNASTITAGGVTDVKEELHAGSSITSSSAFNVGQPNSAPPPPTVPVIPGTTAWDGYVLGAINASAPMTFYKDLYVPPAAPARTGVAFQGGGSVKTASFSVPPPCDSCGASMIPVGMIVDTYASSASNDNATIGLSPSAMSNLSGTTRLDLPCGYYYLDGIKSSGSVTVFAHGHTALFIGGDASAFALSFTLDPGGSFDVFVKGGISTTSDLIIGNPNYAALTRVYMGSPRLTLAGEAHFAGLFYAAGSDINLQSHITAYGALYCNNFLGQGDNTDIHYDKAALSQSYGCDVSPGTCTTCADCGNQACLNGTCSPCTTSADCCPPLICNAGTCQ